MSEQRQHPRTPFQTTVEVIDIESGVDFLAESIELSPRGLSFLAPMEPALGAEMEVTLRRVGTAPARFTALRIDQTPRGYVVAGSLDPR
ncbi:MAG: PilZ domain-containing protein [Archangiaceae bacterium]|nr:PilZ domain-containing protein [Archangiaceae bacterium]